MSSTKVYLILKHDRNIIKRKLILMQKFQNSDKQIAQYQQLQAFYSGRN